MLLKTFILSFKYISMFSNGGGGGREKYDYFPKILLNKIQNLRTKRSLILDAAGLDYVHAHQAKTKTSLP